MSISTIIISCGDAGNAEQEPNTQENADNVFTITEKPTAMQEADRLAIWFPASDFEPVGIYLAPNESIKIEVENRKGTTQPKLLVGTYSRYKSNEVPTEHDLAAGRNTISDKKGGLLYLKYVTEDTPSGVAEVTIKGGTKVPVYTLGKTTHEEWLNLLDSMADTDVHMVSNRTMLTITKETALKYKDQNQDSMLMMLDKVSDIEDYISGIDGSSDLHKPNVHKMQITELTEKDLDFGLAAEEHRIMVPTKSVWNLMEPESTSSKAWGLWHEMGHHRQALNWDWGQVDEVTVNIYSLACLYGFNGTMTWLKGSDIWDVVSEYFKSPIEERNFNNDITIKGNGRLAMFRQLWMAYGDEFYIGVHKLAREDNAKPNPRVEPRTENTESQMANFMILASQASGHNLGDFFREWGFVLPQKDYDALAALNLPDPEIDLIALRE